MRTSAPKGLQQKRTTRHAARRATAFRASKGGPAGGCGQLERPPQQLEILCTLDQEEQDRPPSPPLVPPPHPHPGTLITIFAAGDAGGKQVRPSNESGSSLAPL